MAILPFVLPFAVGRVAEPPALVGGWPDIICLIFLEFYGKGRLDKA